MLVLSLISEPLSAVLMEQSTIFLLSDVIATRAAETHIRTNVGAKWLHAQ